MHFRDADIPVLVVKVTSNCSVFLPQIHTVKEELVRVGLPSTVSTLLVSLAGMVKADLMLVIVLVHRYSSV